MDRETFCAFQGLVYELCGISLNDSKEAMVSSRIGKRMRVLGLDTPRQYLEQLRGSEGVEEITHFLDAISTNVTSFFREPDHFAYLSDQIEDWIRQGSSRLRVWSAAASTGEEPYTIAMTIAAVAGGRMRDWRILATDISTRALGHAARGQYSAQRVAGVPRPLLHQYFVCSHEPSGALYTVKESLKKHILFRRLNLSKLPFPMRGQLDVIFCRNVMIYFDTQTRTRLVEEFYRLLRPGGLLLTGHAESLAGVKASFEYLKPAYYRKPV